MLYIIASAAACLGGIIDLKTRKIPNKLTIPAALAGMALQTAVNGRAGAGSSFLGFWAGAVTILFWLLRILRAGDCKLYMAVGAIGGWKFSVATIIVSTLAGGAAATVRLLMQKQGRQTIKHIQLYVLNCIYARKLLIYEPVSHNSYFSYGCCIGAGAVISSFLLTA